MNEDKYYTPELTELTVDFEYEVKYLSGNLLRKEDTKEEWIKINDFTNAYDYEDSCLYGFIKDLEKGNIRVKYLDSSDIESLGFTYKNNVFKSNKTYFGIGTGDDKKLIIELFSPDGILDIYFLENRGSQETLFSGKIKNISELRKLLKQLNIE